MPELPEVQTTVNGINRIAQGATITDVWTDLAVQKPSLPHHYHSVKSVEFFTAFKKIVVGASIIKAERRAKNILIHLSNNYTILIHLKMTGHVLYGRYVLNEQENTWFVSPEENNDALRDPFNGHIHVVFSITGNTNISHKDSAITTADKNSKTLQTNNSSPYHLVLSDVRKFANVTIVPTDTLAALFTEKGTGPEPLDEHFTEKVFITRLLLYPKRGIKQTLLDQKVLAGVGNIYSDEALWLACIHPLRTVSSLSQKEMHELYKAVLQVLHAGIQFGGDSTSDYRDIDGKPGSFHGRHEAYRKTGSACRKKGCTGTITRIAFQGRGAHFCDVHQK